MNVETLRADLSAVLQTVRARGIKVDRECDSMPPRHARFAGPAALYSLTLLQVQVDDYLAQVNASRGDTLLVRQPPTVLDGYVRMRLGLLKKGEERK